MLGAALRVGAVAEAQLPGLMADGANLHKVAGIRAAARPGYCCDCRHSHAAATWCDLSAGAGYTYSIDEAWTGDQQRFRSQWSFIFYEQVLQEAKAPPLLRAPVEVIAFCDEEGLR